ncbi:GNVR domain-containing protein [Pseudoalteromonas tunicata]|uniref:GNVR domain-containing protein n=1 Tax=Pseudoalteromonas tunicata TaxID=314281 RepID=UPI00273F2DAA|nr:GNVR domain-containing protein [Pseudoalteromonas tunicata]MDP4985545.1 sugar transporter [Pseudoalteromonas tunicata]
MVREQIKRLIYLALYALFSKIRLMILPLLIVPSLVIVSSLLTQKQYINNATILIEESSLLNPFLDDLSFSFELKGRMDALKTLIIGRKVLTDVAKTTGLVAQDASEIEVDEMQRRLSQGLSLALVGDELVKISFTWPVREQMQPVLEQVVEKFIESLLAPTKTSLDTSEQFFLQQLEVLRAELELSEDLLAQFKNRNSETLPQLFSANRNALDGLEHQLREKRVLLSGAQGRLDALVKKLSKTNPVVGILEDKIVHLESDIALLRTRYTDKHSQIQAKFRELENLRTRQNELLAQHKELDVNDMNKLWQMANTLPGQGAEGNLLVSQLVAFQEAKNNVEQQQQEFDMVTSQLNTISSRLLQTNDIEKELRKLERDYDVKQLLYKEMLSRYEMAKVTGKLVRYEGPDKIKTIERAYSPTQVVNTPLGLIIVIGIILGLVAGIAVIFVSALLDSSVKDVASIEQITGGKVLVVLPVIDQSTYVPSSPIENPAASQLSRGHHD